MVKVSACLMVPPECSVTKLSCLKWRGEECRWETLGPTVTAVPRERISAPRLRKLATAKEEAERLSLHIATGCILAASAGERYCVTVVT